MRKYQVNEKFFDELNEKSAYWLGFLYADGCVRFKHGRSGELKLKLNSKDKSHIELFLKDIESNSPIKCDDGGKSECCFTYINSNYLVSRLYELGCVQNKTQKIRLPKIESNLISHFIRGYFDGDGCIYKNKNRPNSFVVSICSNNNFINDLNEFFSKGKILKYEKYSVWSLHKIDDIKLFKEFLYKESETFMKRKFDKFNEIDYNFKRDYSLTKNKFKYKLTNPDGMTIIVENLRKFCDENGLVYSTMSNLSRNVINFKKKIDGNFIYWG
jgi:hypothetical protein